jgi:phosphate transport system substrate-binding protein
MIEGCKEALTRPGFELTEIPDDCKSMRQDGPFIEAGENDNLIVQRLVADENALGIFGYSFLFENQDILQDVAINGVEATFENIADGSYPVTRPLLIYVKTNHLGVVDGLKEFSELFISDEMIGEDSMLADRGLIPLDAAYREETRMTFERIAE